MNLFSWLVWYLDNLQSQISFGCHHLSTVFKLWVSKYQLYQRMTRLTVYCILYTFRSNSSIFYSFANAWTLNIQMNLNEAVKEQQKPFKRLSGKKFKPLRQGKFLVSGWLQFDHFCHDDALISSHVTIALSVIENCSLLTPNSWLLQLFFLVFLSAVPPSQLMVNFWNWVQTYPRRIYFCWMA